MSFCTICEHLYVIDIYIMNIATYIQGIFWYALCLYLEIQICFFINLYPDSRSSCQASFMRINFELSEKNRRTLGQLDFALIKM